MHPLGKFASERLVDHPMSFNSALSFESPGSYPNTKMTLASFAVSAVALVKVRLVDNFELRWAKGIGQYPCDPVFCGHSQRSTTCRRAYHQP